jgi:NAD(P)H-flavin reductase
VGEQLSFGDSIAIQGPFGDSWWREKDNAPILALASGTGLAPILSIARSVTASNKQQRFHLYFGVRDEIDIYAEAELHALARDNPAFHYHIVLSEPNEPSKRLNGFLHHIIATDFSDLSGTQIYAAGSPLMVNAAYDTVIKLGVEASAIHCDAFTSSAVTPKHSQ